MQCNLCDQATTCGSDCHECTGDTLLCKDNGDGTTKCVKCVATAVNQASAEAQCKALTTNSGQTAHLVTINNASENGVVRAFATDKGGTNIWIGLGGHSATTRVAASGNGDLPANAFEVGTYGGRYSGDTTGTQQDTPNGHGYMHYTHYYKIIPAVSGYYTFSATPASNWDAELRLWNRSDCTDENELIYEDDPGNGGTEYFNYSLSAGTTYYFAVQGFEDTDYGTYVMSISYSDEEYQYFGWESGENYSYANWNSGEPNNTDEQGTMMYTDGKWNDSEATNTYSFVCEVSGS